MAPKENLTARLPEHPCTGSPHPKRHQLRRVLIEADLVDCIVALPGPLFSSTQIPVCLWFLAKNKNTAAKRGFRDRRQPTHAGLAVRLTSHGD